MTPASDAVLREWPGELVVVERVAPDEVSEQIELLELMLDALFELAGDRFEPLGVELVVGSHDIAADYPNHRIAPAVPVWYLERIGLPAHLAEQDLEHAVHRTAARIEHAALRELGTEALSQPPPGDGLAIACREIWVRAARMRLAPSTAFRGREHFALDLGRGHIRRIPLERDERGGIFISGPVDGYSTQPPIAVRMTKSAGALGLELYMHWSLWSEPGEPGRVALDDGVAKLIAAGWRRE